MWANVTFAMVGGGKLKVTNTSLLPSLQSGSQGGRSGVGYVRPAVKSVLAVHRNRSRKFENELTGRNIPSRKFLPLK